MLSLIYGGAGMQPHIVDRVVRTAHLILDTSSTVREVAEEVGVSKSTVFVDLSKRLPEIDGNLYKRVSELLQFNASVKHIRGGLGKAKKNRG